MEPTIGRLLFLTHRTVHDELDRRLGEHGASLWHWLLLKEAADAEGASQRELAQHMRIEPPTLVEFTLEKIPNGFTTPGALNPSAMAAPLPIARHPARPSHATRRG